MTAPALQTPSDNRTAEDVKAYLAGLPLDLLAQARDLVHQVIRAADWPTVEFVPEDEVDSDTDQDEADLGEDDGHDMICPHCGPAWVANLRAVDVSERTTDDPTLYWPTGRRPKPYISFNYDGWTDYDGLAYQHEKCGKFVSLPQGWIER